MLRNLCLAGLAATAAGKTFFKEQFDDEGWEDRWVESENKAEGERGSWTWTAGEYYGGEESDKGIQTGTDARFYQLSAELDEAFTQTGDLVIQYTVKHEQRIDCGGAYIKLLPAGLDQSDFSGDSEYAIMFGPDICGSGTRKTHAIFGYEGDNLQITEDVKCETDRMSHLYTFHMTEDGDYDILIDGDSVQKGSLEEHWEFLAPRTIKDPDVSKPADWVDEKRMPDPEAVKPEGWDDEPEQIPDPDAEMPEDWDEDEDGEWEPPMVDNPEYKGEWEAPMIDNPDYQGPWVHPEIENPDFHEDDKLAQRCVDCKYVGFELWQVKAGTIFDDILITDSIEEANDFAQETFFAKKDGEKEMYDEQEAEKREQQKKEREEREAERKRKEAEEAEEEDDEEDDGEL